MALSRQCYFDMGESSMQCQNYYRSLLTILPQFFCDEVKRTWGIDFSIDDTLGKNEIKGRSSSNLFEFKDRQHIIRIEDLSREEHARFSLDVLTALYDAHCKIAPELCVGKDGTMKIFRENGGAIMSVFKYKIGHTLDLWTTPTDAQLDMIVKNYKVLNDCLANVRLTGMIADNTILNSQLKEILDCANEGCQEWMPKQPLAETFIQSWKRFYGKATSLLETAETKLAGRQPQIIHGDIHQENILFDGVKDEDEHFVSFLDFEEVAVAPVEVDVIFTALRLAKRNKENPIFALNLDAVDYFLRHYSDSIHELYSGDRDFWHAYFGLQQSLVYLRHRDYWLMKKENGFLQCYNEVLNYNV